VLTHILVPLDGSPLAEGVLPHAVALAQTFDSKVTLLQVVGRVPQVGEDWAVDPLDWKMRQSEAEAYLDRVTESLIKVDLDASCVLLEGKGAEQMIEFTREKVVDLIVLSSHGRGGLSPWNISSVVQKVILQSWVPVLIVRAYESRSVELTGLRYRRVLVPLDGSQRAECVLPLATAVARTQGSELLLGHVVPEPVTPRPGPLTEEEEALADRLNALNREAAEKYLRDLRSRLSGEERIQLLEGGSPAARLHELVEEEKVDLVALSAHGHFADHRWPYGSVALSFVAYGTTPLLILQDIEQEQAVPSKAEIAAKERKGH